MSISSGERIEGFSDRLRNISHLGAEQNPLVDRHAGPAPERSTAAAEQNPLVDRHADPAPERSSAAATLTRRQVFFRFSTRQSMFLLVTLSMCFAVNRHNHFDDFIFLLALVVNPYSVIILMFVILPAWAIWMRARAGRNPFPSGRSIPDGHVRGDSSGSREDVLTELLRSISRIVSEQCPWRRDSCSVLARWPALRSWIPNPPRGVRLDDRPRHLRRRHIGKP
jgi:hypothetical protein